MEILINSIPDRLLLSIGWTIFHSIWIGAVVSILLFILLSLTRKKSANFRYYSSLSFLFGFFIIVGGVFLSMYASPALASLTDIISKTGGNGESGQSMITSGLTIQFAPLLESSVGSAMVSFINNNYFLIALAWIVGIVAMGIRFTGGLLYTSRLKISGVIKPSERLIKIVEELKNRLKIRRAVTILESTVAKIPMTIGSIKPYILIPIGSLSGIPYNQIEAIITHELVHIKRNDFIINIIQSLIEIVLFYHPATWWISSIIRSEREICCDEITIRNTGESLPYIKALLRISEKDSKALIGAVAITGTKHNLLNRIKRITKMANPGFNRADKFSSALISVALIAGILLITGFSPGAGRADQPEPILNIVTEAETLHKSPLLQTHPETFQDTIKISGTVHTTYTDPADNTKKKAELTFKNDKLTNLVIDGKTIPQSDYVKYETFISHTRQELIEATRELEEIDFEEMERDIQEALVEIEEIDFEEMEFEIQEALTNMEEINMEEILQEIDEIDFEKMEFEIQEALKEIEEIDMIEMLSDIEEALIEIEEIDLEEMEIEMLEEIEKINLEDIKREMKINMQEIKNIDIERLRMEMQNSLNQIDKIDREKIRMEMEKSFQKMKESYSLMERDYQKSIESYQKDIEKQKQMLQKKLVELQEQKSTAKKEKKI